METRQTVNAYDTDRAKRYDQFSTVTMGDRRMQRNYLQSLLLQQRFDNRFFMDLGCGTGFFSEVFFEQMPEIRGVLVDGSSAMLDQARARIAKLSGAAEYIQCLFGEIDWHFAQPFDVVFSGYAIHHLTDEDKWALMGKVFAALRPGGAFILFDNFLPRGEKGRTLIEYITCREIERKTRHVTPLEQIIATDRQVKAAEGDQEASFEEHLGKLREIGFVDVTPVFLDARYGGVVAYREG